MSEFEWEATYADDCPQEKDEVLGQVTINWGTA
jgi:hypothetical protein